MKLSGYLLRETRRRSGRALLTIVGIIIGVQALVAVPATISTSRQAYRGLFTSVAGQADLEVVAVGQGGFDARWVDTVAEVPGVRGAEGLAPGHRHGRRSHRATTGGRCRPGTDRHTG